MDMKMVHFVFSTNLVIICDCDNLEPQSSSHLIIDYASIIVYAMSILLCLYMLCLYYHSLCILSGHLWVELKA